MPTGPDKHNDERFAEHLTEIQPTGDGSHTLYSHRFGQQYHDTNGAIDESRHVFFENSGLMERLRRHEEVHILEMGFGTGLNLLLVADALQHTGSRSQVLYTSIEGYPISPATASQLNYQEYLRLPPFNLQSSTLLSSTLQSLPSNMGERFFAPTDLSSLFSAILPGNNSCMITEQLELALFIGVFADFQFPSRPIDIIFFDAFSPKANPELWTSAVFRALYEHAHPGAVMSTYCAAVSARAAMCHAGWHVARGPGFKTRREMTIASRDPDRLEGLARVDEARYARRYADGEFGAP
jgi:tRNA U34 5-methylaminomethyl-2-thiouridine-forming methyltransferase MnmC